MIRCFSDFYQVEENKGVANKYDSISSNLITNYNKCPKEIKEFIDDYYNRGLDYGCAIISDEFSKKFRDSEVVVGYYNPFKGPAFSKHVWVRYKGKPYDLRGILENRYKGKTMDYDKIKIVKSTPSSNLKTVNKGPQTWTEQIDDSKVKYFSKCPSDGCVQKKPNGKWGVISGKTGKFWDADYDSKEDARAGLRAYFANKRFSLSTLDLYGKSTGQYEPVVIVFLQDGKSFVWYSQQLPKQFRDSPLSEIAISTWYNEYKFKKKGNFFLLINRYHPQFRQTIKEYNDFLNNNFLIR